MSADEYEALRQQLLKAYTKIRDEFRQLVIDMQAWNAAHPDETPFDIGENLCSAVTAHKIVKLLDAGKPIPQPLIDELLGRTL